MYNKSFIGPEIQKSLVGEGDGVVSRELGNGSIETYFLLVDGGVEELLGLAWLVTYIKVNMLSDNKWFLVV